MKRKVVLYKTLTSNKFAIRCNYIKDENRFSFLLNDGRIQEVEDWNDKNILFDSEELAISAYKKFEKYNEKRLELMTTDKLLFNRYI